MFACVPCNPRPSVEASKGVGRPGSVARGSVRDQVGRQVRLGFKVRRTVQSERSSGEHDVGSGGQNTLVLIVLLGRHYFWCCFVSSAAVTRTSVSPMEHL